MLYSFKASTHFKTGFEYHIRLVGLSAWAVGQALQDQMIKSDLQM